MRAADYARFSLRSIRSHRLRSGLTSLGIAVGIAAVILLTSIGEGIHRFVLAEFTQFGTNLIGINPGKSETHGISVGVFANSRPLTIDDALALERVTHARAVVPLVWGNAEVEALQRRRRTTVYGVSAKMPEAYRMQVQVGRFLPEDSVGAPRAFAVLGSKLRTELFGIANPLGQRIRIGGHGYRIIGVMASKGDFLGFDMDDTVFIPAARALEMFNRESLMEIDLLYAEGVSEATVVKGIDRILRARHGREDYTITTQQQMLDVLGSVLNVLTTAVGALGGISLLVGAIGILTIMTIAVRERTPEIGLLRALGTTRQQILVLFLGEAVVLAAIGGLAGLAIGAGGASLLGWAVPALPVHTPLLYVFVAEALAIVIGLIAGVIPARRAAGLDPVVALQAE